MDYIVTKLVSGEIIVGLANEMSDNHIQIAYPYEVIKETVYDEMNSYTKTSLVKYMPYSAEEVLMLQVDKTVYISDLKPELISAYKGMVDSNEAVSEEPQPSVDSFFVDASSNLQ